MTEPQNPYLPSTTDRLASMLASLGAGISMAGSQGQPLWAGLGPAAMMYGQANDHAQQEAQRALQWQQSYQQQEAYRKAQEEALAAQTVERKQEAEARAQGLDYLKGLHLGGGVPTASPGGMGVQPGPATMGPDFKATGAPMVSYLNQKYGLPAPAAAGVVGNLYQESKFQPTASGDGGTAFGMGQWRGDRFTGLQQFAQSQGKPVADPQVQLDYLMKEMQGGDMGAQRAYAMLQQAKTPQDATTAMMHFFRPAGYTPGNPTAGNGYANRVQYAQALMPGAGGPQVAQGGGDPSGSPAGQPMPTSNPQVMQMPGSGTGAVMPPRIDPAAGIPLLMSKTLAPLGQGIIGLGNTETQRYTSDLDRAQKEAQFREEQRLREDAARRANDNADVIRDPNGQPVVNQPLIGAKAGISAVQGTDPAGHGQKLLMDQAVKAHGEYQANASAARSGLANVSRLESLLDGLNTGKTKEVSTDMKAYLKDLGVDLSAFNMNDDVGRSQAAQAIASQAALTLRNPASGGGLPGSMSNYEDKLLQNMSPGLLKTPEGNKLLIETTRAAYQRSLELGKITNQWMRSKDNLTKDPAGLFAVVDKYVEDHPLWTKEQEALLRSGGPAGNGAAASPTAATPAAMPTPAAPPQPGFTKDGYRFKGGDPGQRMNWEKVQ